MKTELIEEYVLFRRYGKGIAKLWEQRDGFLDGKLGISMEEFFALDEKTSQKIEVIFQEISKVIEGKQLFVDWYKERSDWYRHLGSEDLNLLQTIEDDYDSEFESNNKKLEIVLSKLKYPSFMVQNFQPVSVM